MKVQSRPIEAKLTELHSNGFNVLTPKYTSNYLKIYNILNSYNFDDKRTDYEYWQDLINSYRKIYNYLPSTIKTYADRNVYLLNKPTQIKALKIKEYNETLFFILHNNENPDQSIEIEYFDTIPSIKYLMNFTNNTLNPKTLNELIIKLQNFKINKVNLHTINGYGLAQQSEAESQMCLCGYLPYDISNIEFTGLLEDALLLKGLCRNESDRKYKFLSETLKENLHNQSKSIPIIIYVPNTIILDSSESKKTINCLSKSFAEIGWKVKIIPTNNYPKTGVIMTSYSASIQPTNDLFNYIYNALRDSNIQFTAGGTKTVDPTITQDQIEIYIGLSSIFLK